MKKGLLAGVAGALFVQTVRAQLPEGWIDAPFGLYTLAQEGGSWFDDATTATLTGSGAGMGGSPPSTDGGRYLFKRLSGDAELVADVPFLSRTILNDSARAGVMFRSSGDRHDRFAGLMREPGTATEPARIRFQYRSAKGSNSASQTPVAGVAQGTTNYLSNYDMPMIRLRLVRQGTKLYGYLSTNQAETVWFKAFEPTLTLGEDVLAGLFVSRAAVRQVEVMTNTFGNVTVRELVTAVRNGAGDRRVVSWTTDLPDAPAGATYRLSYATSYTGAFTLLADDATPPYETAADWMTGTSLYFRVQYVTAGATNLLGTSGACALRLPQPARAAPAQNGLWAAYYAPTNASVPLAERLETAVADNWTNAVAGLGATNFRVVYNGAVTPTESGLYVFGSEADDTMQVTLNATAVLEDIYADTNGMVSISRPFWLEAGRTYGLRADYAQATDDRRASLKWARQGDSAFEPVPVSTLTPFPLPWTHADLGVTDIGGYAEYDWAAAAFTVSGAGMGLGGTADSFRYVWRERTGDFDLAARVALAAGNTARATAGLLFRESSAANAAGAGVYLVEGADTVQVVARARTATGGATETLATGPSYAKGQAVRLKVSRSGYTLSFACRAEGAGEWTPVASVVLALPEAGVVGLAVATQEPASPVAAVFDALSEAAFTTIDVAPVADTYVQVGFPDTVNGSATTLQVKRQDLALYTRESFLKFDLRRQSAARSAFLKLYVTTNNVALSSQTVACRRLADNAWQEAAVTWNNPPLGTWLPSAFLDTLDPSFIGTALAPAIGEWLTFDVTEAYNRSVAADGFLSVGLSAHTFNAGAQLTLASREYATASRRPRLVVVPGAPGAPTVRPGASGTQATVTWEALADASAYRVWRAAGAPSGFAQVSGDLTGLTFADSGLTAGTTYFFAVSAVTPAGETALSPPAALAATAQAAVTVLPTDDAYVRGGVNANTNYGASVELVLKNEGWTNKDNSRETFLRFDTVGWGGAEKAVLSLTFRATSVNATPKVLDLWVAPDSEWSESTVTWNNISPVVGLPLTNGRLVPEEGKVIRLYNVPAIQYTNLQVDVTSLVRAAARTGSGKLTLGVSKYDTDTSTTMSFYSKEQTGSITNYIPKLTVLSVRPGVPEAVPAAGGVGLVWPAFRGALTYTVRRADARDGTYAVLASGLTGTAYTAAAPSGWFTVSAVTAGGETPASDALFAEKGAAYEARLPAADTFVESGGAAGVNYGANPTLTIKAAPMSPTRENFLRFDVTGLERAASVRLRLNVAATSAGYTPSSLLIYGETAGEWNEGLVTWNTMIPGLTVPLANGAARGVNELARIPYLGYDNGERVGFIEADVTEAVRAAALAGRQPTFRVCGDTLTTGASVMWTTAAKEVGVTARLPLLLADVGPFGAPAAARAVRDEAGRAAELTWAAVPGAASYTVRRLLPGGGSVEVAAGLTGTTLALSGLWNNGTVYPYEVVAVRADGAVSEAARIDVALDRQEVRAILDDTFIRGGPSSNDVYGAGLDIQIKRDDDPQYSREGYLRLDVAELGDFTRALLRLRVAGVNNTAMTVVAQAVEETGWTETGAAALTWETAPVKRVDNPAQPVAGELGRVSMAGSAVGTVHEWDVTAGLKAWLSQRPGATSVVVHLFSVDVDGGGAKQINFTSGEGAMLPEYAPAMVYTVETYPAPGTRLILK